ncbi:HCL332Cp [Eremothecium sinecaudum]|uniref:DASH complex subunit DUO1 n=1 Tax=Eremothecium sinecaudum TaxID=45286 RepID=A0A120K1W7_9SACH|nr:HCL332Cp [Eremothecium sinecaudum]AMD19819.1 HCL332Cp [Eremothecium sinecaudum]
MPEEDISAQNIDKLIPRIFDQMRSNQVNNTKKTVETTPWFTSSSISTSVLLKELEQLDKIIPVIKHLNGSLRNSTMDNLSRIKMTCRSVNKVLDSWLKIQSQASYVGELMDDDEYLQYIEETKGDEAKCADYMNKKRLQVEELRRKVDEKLKPVDSITVHAPPLRKGMKTTTLGARGRMQGSGIPKGKSEAVSKVRSGYTRGDAAKGRKLFR